LLSTGAAGLCGLAFTIIPLICWLLLYRARVLPPPWLSLILEDSLRQRLALHYITDWPRSKAGPADPLDGLYIRPAVHHHAFAPAIERPRFAIDASDHARALHEPGIVESQQVGTNAIVEMVSVYETEK